MEIFALLAEPVRRRIIEILATGEHSSGVVADVVHHEFRVSRSAVSRHLGILTASGFAAARIEGPFRMYRLEDDALAQLDQAVDHLHDLWDARYGWPYLTDPMAIRTPPVSRGRGRRGRSDAPVVVSIDEVNDPWQWLGD